MLYLIQHSSTVQYTCIALYFCRRIITAFVLYHKSREAGAREVGWDQVRGMTGMRGRGLRVYMHRDAGCGVGGSVCTCTGMRDAG